MFTDVVFIGGLAAICGLWLTFGAGPTLLVVGAALLIGRVTISPTSTRQWELRGEGTLAGFVQ